MKQCPNPNCVFYTRLEELPDAYIKCPGCGGLLVDSDTLSGKLAVDPRAGGAGGADEFTPYSGPLYYPDSPQLGASASAADPFQPPAQSLSAPYAPEEGPPVQQVQAVGDPVGYVETARRQSPASALLIAAGAIFLLIACGLLAWLLSDNLFPKSKFVGGAEATETALSSIRPAVNTPILPPATITLAPLPESSPTAVAEMLPTEAPTLSPPTQAAPPPPTQVPPTNLPTQPPVVAPTATTEVLPPSPIPAPTAVVVVQTAVAQQPTPGPTAPLPQTRPAGGIVSAGMSRSLSGGEAPGTVSEYSATDPFHLAVQARFGPGGVTAILTRWYGPDGRQIYEMRQIYSREGTYYAGFTLRKNGPWDTGGYRVDVYTNGSPTPDYSVTFSVVP